MTRERNTYLVEQYRPDLGRGELEQLAARVRRAVDRFERAGNQIHFLRSTIVPADESILTIVEARSEKVVREAFAGTEASIDRISTAIEQGGRP